MTNFVRNGLYFVAGILLSFLVLGLLLPAKMYWGNQEYLRKIELSRTDKFNAAFLGSSRILTGINPFLFDSLINLQNRTKIKSINLATPGTWANETFYLYETLLADTSISGSLDLVFLEFQNIMAIKFNKLTSDKAIYYQSANNLAFISKYALNEIRLSVKNTPAAAYLLASYSLAYLQNILSFQRFEGNKLSFDTLTYFGINSRGYLGLSKKKQSKRAVSNKILDAYKQSATLNLTKPITDYNKTFRAKCIQLINRSKARGIKLVFVLPPVRLTRGMAAVFRSLPVENRIEVCNPQTFPKLYYIDNWIDETHLSENGSYFLNTYLVNEYTKSITEATN